MNNFQWCAIHKKYQTFGTQMNKESKFLKKTVVVSVGEYMYSKVN